MSGNSSNVVKAIAIAVGSSILGALLTFLGASSLGLFTKVLTEAQLQQLAIKMVNDESYSEVLLRQMKKSGEFKGPIGDRGPEGKQGPEGPPGPGLEALAIISVKKGNIEFKSEGVSYNKGTGIVSFPNPKNLKFVPLITDYGTAATYTTATHFLREDGFGSNQFRVWRTPLDTGDRNSSPLSFTAIAIGF